MTDVGTSTQRPITGKRLGWRGVIAQCLLERGESQRHVARFCDLSLQSVNSISQHKLFSGYTNLIREFDAIEKSVLKHGYLESVLKAHDEGKSPTRQGAWLTNAEKWKKLEAPQGQADGLTVADILAAIGARRATVISRTTTQQVVVAAESPAPIDVTPRNPDGGTSCVNTGQGEVNEGAGR